MNEVSIIINGVRYDAVDDTHEFSCKKRILKAMNEVSIIINGVRYDAVDDTHEFSCKSCCDIHTMCRTYGNYKICEYLGVPFCAFKKSDKKFEK